MDLIVLNKALCGFFPDLIFTFALWCLFNLLCRFNYQLNDVVINYDDDDDDDNRYWQQ